VGVDSFEGFGVSFLGVHGVVEEGEVIIMFSFEMAYCW